MAVLRESSKEPGMAESSDGNDDITPGNTENERNSDLASYLYVLGGIPALIAFFLILFLLVGLLDNVLRPFLIEGRVKMHSLLIFFSLLGGIGYFGMPGMIFGPIIVALGLTFLELYKLEFGMDSREPSPE